MQRCASATNHEFLQYPRKFTWLPYVSLSNGNIHEFTCFTDFMEFHKNVGTSSLCSAEPVAFRVFWAFPSVSDFIFPVCISSEFVSA